MERRVWRVVLRAWSEVSHASPTQEMLESWHLEVFEGVPPCDYYAGAVRQAGTTTRPCLEYRVGVGNVEGSRPRNVKRDLRKLLREVDRRLAAVEKGWASLSLDKRVVEIATVIGTAVGWFIKIHPFVNGNGRLSRILWRALLKRYDLPPQMPVLEHPPGPVYDALMAAAMQGNYAPVVRHVYQTLRGAPHKPTLRS
ncbi:MAG: Fic family protein [Myxococcales bacterium]|nr:Fic family protein [Myxococcales bacterium]